MTESQWKWIRIDSTHRNESLVLSVTDAASNALRVATGRLRRVSRIRSVRVISERQPRIGFAAAPTAWRCAAKSTSIAGPAASSIRVSVSRGKPARSPVPSLFEVALQTRRRDHVRRERDAASRVDARVSHARREALSPETTSLR